MDKFQGHYKYWRILQKKNIKIIKHNIKNNDYMLVSKFNGSKIRFYT